MENVINHIETKMSFINTVPFKPGPLVVASTETYDSREKFVL